MIYNSYPIMAFQAFSQNSEISCTKCVKVSLICYSHSENNLHSGRVLIDMYGELNIEYCSLYFTFFLYKQDIVIAENNKTIFGPVLHPTAKQTKTVKKIYILIECWRPLPQKKALKTFVPKPIKLRRIVGKKTVKRFLKEYRLFSFYSNPRGQRQELQLKISINN